MMAHAFVMISLRRYGYIRRLIGFLTSVSLHIISTDRIIHERQSVCES